MYGVLDVEGIATYVMCNGKTHICTRKLYIMSENGRHQECYEFSPCRRLFEIESKFQKSYRYCQKFIHKLPYYPQNRSLSCTSASSRLRQFVERNNITIIFYKGGHLEKDLCDEINVQSFNIERFNVPKINSHDPYTEVQGYWKFLQSFCTDAINSLR